MAELQTFILDILVIAVSFIALNWASNLAINNAVRLSKITRLGKTAVGSVIYARRQRQTAHGTLEDYTRNLPVDAQKKEVN